MSVFHACMVSTVSYGRLPSISIFWLVFADFPFFQITSDYLILEFSRSFSKETTTNLIHLLDQAFSSIVPRWPNHDRLLSCKNSLVLFSFSLFLSFLCRNRIPRLNVAHPSNHNVITSFSLTSQFLLSHGIALCTHVEYNQPFSRKRCIYELTQSSLDHCYNIVKCTPSGFYCVTKITKLSHNFKRLAIEFYAWTIFLQTE